MRYNEIFNEVEDELPEGFAKIPDAGDGPDYEFDTPWGRGLCGIDWVNHQCFIEYFSSKSDRQGNGRKTLQWLRPQFSHIEIIKPGDRGSISLAFWKQMQNEGLVDVVLDTDYYNKEFKS